jgi:hypothetical protein
MAQTTILTRIFGPIIESPERLCGKTRLGGRIRINGKFYFSEAGGHMRRDSSHKLIYLPFPAIAPT